MRAFIPLSAILPFLVLAGCLPTFESDHPSPMPRKVQAFKEVPTPFSHIWTQPSHPFTGAAVIDSNGDGAFEVFVSGGRNQADMLLAYQQGKLVNVIASTGLSQTKPATHGAASSDMDNDGDIDLVVARENGVTLYLNKKGKFTAHKLPIDLEAETVPLSVSVADINGDNLPDIYISKFVSFSAFKSATFNDPTHLRTNIMLLNKGNNRFEDVTEKSQTKGKQNTFHTTFADLDNDGFQDMILAQNTGEIEIFKASGKGKFSNIATNSGFGYWMGIAVGDIDQDGDQDIFISNIGTSIPDFLTSGDLKDNQPQNSNWKLLRNDGNMKFADITKDKKLDGYGFAWGGVFEDLNLDGKLDLLVAQNYIKWPVHKIAPLDGKVLLQGATAKSRGFYQVEGLGLENPYFGQSPINVDLNADGRVDILWLNMNGPLRAFINKSKGNFITVKVPDNVKNLGANIRVVMADGKVYNRQVVASTGLMTDPTPDLHFGLGKSTKIKYIEMISKKGEKTQIINPAINQTVKFNPETDPRYAKFWRIKNEKKEVF